MKDNRKRRVLNTNFDYENSSINDSNTQMYNSKNQRFNSYDKKKRYNILRIIFLISFIFSTVYVGFLFINSLFVFRHRLILIAILILFYILVLWILSARRKVILKTLSLLIMLFLTFIEIAFLILYGIAYKEMKDTNRENIVVSREVAKSDAFNVYFSGLDVVGDISTVSRSDVNIIASLNLNTGKGILTSVPRDSYLPIAGEGNNELDKLTHAGNYGVKSSMDTISNALLIDLSYYAKVNFTSFVDIVDIIGGIDVYNDQAFTSRVSGKFYDKGNIYLDGAGALDFVRERYGLADGDLDRGRNQEKVIKAILKKSVTPSNILNMKEILKVVGKSVSTNIPINKLFNIASSYVFNLGFDIRNQELDGYYEYLPSYAMSGYELSMYVLYDESIIEVRDNIERLLSK